MRPIQDWESHHPQVKKGWLGGGLGDGKQIIRDRKGGGGQGPVRANAPIGSPGLFVRRASRLLFLSLRDQHCIWSAGTTVSHAYRGHSDSSRPVVVPASCRIPSRNSRQPQRARSAALFFCRRDNFYPCRCLTLSVACYHRLRHFKVLSILIHC